MLSLCNHSVYTTQSYILSSRNNGEDDGQVWVLMDGPQHDEKQAYKTRSLVESALHKIVSRIREQMQTEGYNLHTFLDVGRTFSATSY